MSHLRAIPLYLVLLLALPAQAAPPCPRGSAPDRRASLSDDLIGKCIFARRDGALRRGHIVQYELYCPMRFSQSAADAFARKLALDRYERHNPVRPEFERAGLVPIEGRATHVFHYACNDRGRPGVATHLKLTYKIHAPREVEAVARSCTLRAESGRLAVNTRLDREYRCRSMFYSTDPWAFIGEVATRLAERDLLPAARERGLKICLLYATNIQCAPCKRSDKLVLRAMIRSRPGDCLRGEYRRVW